MRLDDDERRDTDRAPRSGNGGDKSYPCAAHQAALVELREALRSSGAMMLEVRDMTRLMAQRLDDEIAGRKDRDDDLTQAILELTASIGTSPDPISGSPGTGLKGAVCVALNHTIRAEAKSKYPPSMREESEITGMMDRASLVVAKRVAKHELLEARARARKIEIGAWTGGVVLVIGAVTAAVAQILSTLGG